MNIRDALRELAEPWPSGSYAKEAIDRAARMAGLSYTRCSDIWYSKARRLDPQEIDKVEAAVARKREREARNELQELRTRLTKLETRLSTTDPDFYRPAIDWLGRTACRSS